MVERRKPFLEGRPGESRASEGALEGNFPLRRGGGRFPLCHIAFHASSPLRLEETFPPRPALDNRAGKAGEARNMEGGDKQRENGTGGVAGKGRGPLGGAFRKAWGRIRTVYQRHIHCRP